MWCNHKWSVWLWWIGRWACLNALKLCSVSCARFAENLIDVCLLLFLCCRVWHEWRFSHTLTGSFRKLCCRGSKELRFLMKTLCSWWPERWSSYLYYVTIIQYSWDWLCPTGVGGTMFSVCLVFHQCVSGCVCVCPFSFICPEWMEIFCWNWSQLITRKCRWHCEGHWFKAQDQIFIHWFFKRISWCLVFGECDSFRLLAAQPGIVLDICQYST